MAWRSSGNNNTEMVDKLTRKQPIICHSMSLISCYTPFVALFCICYAFCSLFCLQIAYTIAMGDRMACVVIREAWMVHHILVIVLSSDSTVRMDQQKHPKTSYVNHASMQV